MCTFKDMRTKDKNNVTDMRTRDKTNVKDMRTRDKTNVKGMMGGLRHHSLFAFISVVFLFTIHRSMLQPDCIKTPNPVKRL